MDSKFGFTRMAADEFAGWIAGVKVQRPIRTIQQHHTWKPNYASFSGSNHFALQRGMQEYHVKTNKWADIGQHFSIFPDGMILTGRPLDKLPACIKGQNAGAICIENVGDFDIGRDEMRPEQKEAIITVTALLARRFAFPDVTTDTIVYHHWFDLNTGKRTDGAGSTKTCPGTAFFGGNSVAACATGFLPLVRERLTALP